MLIVEMPIGLRRIEAPGGIHVDFGGNDTHVRAEQGITRHPAYGAGTTGIGIHFDLAGNDTYVGGSDSGGSGFFGVGILWDPAGADERSLVQRSNGFGNVLGVLRDDSGTDLYRGGAISGGATNGRPSDSLGLLWERGGVDRYAGYPVEHEAYGWADLGSSGSGWLVDEGIELDEYLSATPGAFVHGCNDCEWVGNLAPGGRGNDNSGGLSYMFAERAPFLRGLRP